MSAWILGLGFLGFGAEPQAVPTATSSLMDTASKQDDRGGGDVAGDEQYLTDLAMLLRMTAFNV